MTNPSYEYMRRIRREEQAKLLDLRRERAVKALRSLDLHGGSHAMLAQIAYAAHPHVGAWDAESCDHLCNVLIELIGGDHEAVSSNQRHCACGVGGCDRGHESEAVGDLSHDTSSMRQENKTGITDELRKYVSIHETTTTVYATMPPQMEEGPTHKGKKLLAIADKIDAQFERSSERHEVVLQDANNIQLLVECLKPAIADNDKRVVELEAERDELKEDLFKYDRSLTRSEMECRMYLDLLRDATRDYKALRDKLNLVFDMWANATNGGAHE